MGTVKSQESELGRTLRTSTSPLLSEPSARDSNPTDPCAVVHHKSLRRLLLDCEARRSSVVLLVDGAETSGELVLLEGQPFHASFEGRIGSTAFVALVETNVVLLRMAMPRSLARYTRSISLGLGELGVVDEALAFPTIDEPAMPAPLPSALELEGTEPRDGAVIISRSLMRASYAAWPVATPVPEGVLHAVYVFGEADETLHLAGEKLGRALLRNVVTAVRQAGAFGIARASLHGMVVYGATSQEGYGCLVATRENDDPVARNVATELWTALAPGAHRSV
jgi:hypothetical protein